MNDQLKALLKYKKNIIFCSLFFGALFAFAVLGKPIRYQAEGVFRDRINKQTDMDKIELSAFLMPQSDGKEAIALMQSKSILKQVVLKEQLQGVLHEKKYALKRIPYQIGVYLSYLQNQEMPKISDPGESLNVAYIHYPGELPIRLTLHPEGDKRYSVWEKKNKIGEGVLGELFVGQGYEFILEGSLFDKRRLTLISLDSAAKRLKKALKIQKQVKTPNFISLQAKARSREAASSMVNSLMETYLEYLNEEKTYFASRQLAYLHQREKEIEKDLSLAVHNYAKNLSSSCSEKGYGNIQKAIECLGEQYQSLEKGLLKVKIQSNREQRINHSTDALTSTFEEGGAPKFIENLLLRKTDLVLWKESLEAAMEQSLIDRPSPIVGLDLAMAKAELIAQTKALTDALEEKKQLEYLIDHPVQMTGLSALPSTARDPIAKRLVEETTQFFISLEDEENRGEKEKVRLRKEISNRSQFLLSHLKQTVELVSLKIEQHLKKINELQVSIHHLIESEIALIEFQLDEMQERRLKTLALQEEVLSEEKKQLKEHLSELPNMWAEQELIEGKVRLYHRLVEQVAKMVEGMNVKNNIDYLRSSPIDTAYAPLLSTPPRLLFSFTAGAFFGGLIASAFCFFKSF